MPETKPEEIEAKQKAYQRLSGGSNWRKLKTLADIQTAQFFIPKTVEHRDHLITDGTYKDMLKGINSMQGRDAAYSIIVSNKKKFFHWFLEFPEVFANGGFTCILGNPPFLGGQRLSGTFGHDYLEWLKYQYAPIGASDLVTYFYRRIFTIIREGGFQSLLATNTIAQGDAREYGLAIIHEQGGTINYAIRSMRWPGLAAVEVAQVAVYKGKWNKEFILDNKKVECITSYLDDSEDLGDPFKLQKNKRKSFQGSIVFGKGFLLNEKDVKRLISLNPKNQDVIFPYLIGRDLNNRPDQSPSRWVINFFDWDENKCRKEYPDCYEIVEKLVKPERQKLEPKNSTNIKRRSFWWLFGADAKNLYDSIINHEKVFVHTRVTKTHGFILKNTGIVFDGAVVVFSFSEFEKFSILQSDIHNYWSWIYSSSLKGDRRYAPSDCFETFPFPQNLSTETESELKQIGETYHEFRRQLMLKMQLGLTKTYNQFHNPQLSSEIAGSDITNRKELQKKFGKETVNLWSHLQKIEDVCSLDEAIADIKHLRKLHKEMDEAVLKAYGWDDLAHDFYEVDYLPENDRVRFTISPEARKEVLRRLLLLNHEIYEQEVAQGLHDKKKKKAKAKKKPKVIENPGQVGMFSTGTQLTNKTLISEPLAGYGYQVGQNVNHASFGKGTIKDIEGLGDTARITIRFEAGEKKLVAKYAGLGVE